MRKILNKTSQPTAWFEQTGPESDVVLTTRIRLARNIEGLPFPQWADDEPLKKIGKMVKNAIDLSRLSDLKFYSMKEMPTLERNALAEEHLTSPQFAKEDKEFYLAISDSKEISIMINEEDHVRIQTIYSGLQLENAWNLANYVDDELGKNIKYAFSDKWGYLTACPTNVGTALRVSLMLHLPALVMTQQLASLFQTTVQFGVVVRGLFGEGTHAVGNYYQISNGTTLGRSESEIIEHLKGVGMQIIDREKTARKMLLSSKSKIKVIDRSNRALGILRYAKTMSFEEAMELLSMVRLGVDMNLLDGITRTQLNKIMINMRSSHLSIAKKVQLTKEQENAYRCQIIQNTLN